MASVEDSLNICDTFHGNADGGVGQPEPLLSAGLQFVPLSQQFDLHEQLGQGGMGTVWKAWDRSLKRFVAIKRVRSSLLHDPSFFGDFLREARANARMKHDNIVTVHAMYQDAEGPFMVLEFVDGESLTAKLAREETLNRKSLLRITRGICLGLQHAHQHIRSHRDIKPGNILVQRDGTAKLADFGLARAAQQDPSVQSEGVLGTRGYMAPEQIDNPGQADFRSDLWSLGATLYQMVTGKRPPDSRDFNVSEVPQQLGKVLLRATAEDPRDRYQSAMELCAAVESALHESPPPKIPPPIIKRDKSGKALYFDWGHPAVGDKDVCELSSLTSNREKRLSEMVHLKTLQLSGTGISDRSLNEIAGLPALRVLNLANTSITDNGLMNLSGMKTLEEIWLTACPVTDRGLDYLSALPALQILKLCETSVTDVTIDSLINMKGLTEVSLGGTGMTADGVSRLVKLRPEMRVLS